PDIIDFLADNQIGVTVSIDGPRELQNRFRVFHNGAGSYDVAAPKIKELLRRHRSRPIGARVTLTSETIDVSRIYRHLTEEFGFWEVGFAPVTTSPNQQYAIGDRGFDRMLGQFRELAFEFQEHVAANKHHGFSNIKDTLASKRKRRRYWDASQSGEPESHSREGLRAWREGRRRRGVAGAARAAPYSARLLTGVLAGMGSGFDGWHRRPVSAGRARHLRLP